MPLPRLPKNTLLKTDALHDGLTELLLRFERQRLDSALCKRIAGNAHYLLGQDVDVSAVFNTLIQYEGRELDSKWCTLLARQLAGRINELKVGALQLFDRPVRDEWVAMEIHKVGDCTWRDYGAGVTLDLYFLNGHPAGHTIQKKFPERWLSFLAYRIGYTRRMQYDHDPLELTGLRFWGYLLAARQDPRELDFEDWKIDPKLKASNQLVLRKRKRFDIDTTSIPESKIEEYSCPFDKLDYCSECDCSAADCCAAYNRGRIGVRGLSAGAAITR